MHGELTAATLKSLTRVLCHEDYKVHRRHFRQGLVDPHTDASWSWQCLRVALFRPVLFFFVFFAVEVLFLAPSNEIKKPKAKMKINAKKTNSTSENAIQASYFVLEIRKLIHL